MELFDAPSDYGSGLASLADAQSSQTQFDNQAEQQIADVLANVGDRSNIRGSVNYDPRFAQAFNLSRGLIAGNRFDNQGNRVQDLSVPTYMQPQIFGDRVDARGEAIRYYSPVERYIQETLPAQIRQIQELSPTGIITNLINKGMDVYDKGKKVIEETFEPEKKSDAGIMETIDRADLPDYTKAILAGMENTNRNLPQATQTAFKVQDILNSPGMISRGLNFVQPYIQEMVPENVKVTTDPLINRDEGTASPQIKFTIPIQDNTLGLGSLFRNLG